MKTDLFIKLALFFFLGCVNQELAQMNSQDQETAKTEIREVVKVIFQSLENMDIEALFQPYLDSPDFILFTTDASMENYEKAKNEHAKWFKSLSTLKVTAVNDEFKFLPGNIVICAWLGKFKMSLKTGMHLKIDKFGITFIFSKIDNQWKVLYQHSSALPPVQE